MKKLISLLLSWSIIVSCGTSSKNNDTTQDESEVVQDEALSLNELSESEKAEGWILLFDGETMDNWKLYGREESPSRWSVKDAALFLDTLSREGGSQDLITTGEFENFEFAYEWKIQDCGNSGVIFNVVDDGTHKYPWETGPEMQVLDDTCHPDSKYPKHRAGDLYDLIEMSQKVVKPAGEWNAAKIISNDGHVEFWMNGVRVVEFTMFTDEWKEMVANSKFKSMPDFGTSRKGHIVLQDHGDVVWYRNLKIKNL